MPAKKLGLRQRLRFLFGGESLRVLDLFCGMGGLALGFGRAGFRVTGVDIWDEAGKCWEHNRIGEFRRLDLSSAFAEGEYEVVTGGPPCKPWSRLNLRLRKRAHPDRPLLSRFFTHILRLRPPVFIMENVPSLASDRVFAWNLRRVVREGYSVDFRVLRYCDFGAASARRRLIVFGSRGGEPENFWSILDKWKERPKNVREAIWDLRGASRGERPDHIWPAPRTIGRYLRLYRTGKFGWYILRWDQPAPSFGNVMKTYILHPDAADGGPARVLSVREAMRIMGFDDGYKFPPGLPMWSRYQMVADAVSPVFSRKLALATREFLE